MLAPLRERFGEPVELPWDGEISELEWSIATYNAARTHDVTLFILDPSQRLALIRKPHFAADVWRPPGGGIKPGEDFVEGAVREALEETGLHVELRRYLVASRGASSATPAASCRGGRTSSSPRPTDEELAPNDPDEIAAPAGAPLAELRAAPLRETPPRDRAARSGGYRVAPRTTRRSQPGCDGFVTVAAHGQALCTRTAVP